MWNLLLSDLIFIIHSALIPYPDVVRENEGEHEKKDGLDNCTHKPQIHPTQPGPGD